MNPLIYKTKSFWTGISLIIGGIGGLLTGTLDLTTASQGIVAGLITIFLRDAIAKK